MGATVSIPGVLSKRGPDVEMTVANVDTQQKKELKKLLATAMFSQWEYNSKQVAAMTTVL
jgi:hypothetical protein